MANDCPRCGLLNPPSAQRCDCGYDLLQRPIIAEPKISARALLFSFEGRIGRYRYWMFLLPYSIVYVALIRLDTARDTLAAGGGIGLYSGIFFLLTLYSSLAVGVKRCHDRDRSGWFLLLGLIPLLGLWPAVELGFLSGTVGPNRFGLPEPKRG
jgi:uncharacterized membrane protein YhaH (DUF805 family)